MGIWWTHKDRNIWIAGEDAEFSKIDTKKDIVNIQSIKSFILSKGSFSLRDTYILSLKKEEFNLNFYFPCFISNSPFDRNEEALILLNSFKKVKESRFDHFSSILNFKNFY